MTLQIDFRQILQPFFANWPWFLGLLILLLLTKLLGSAGFKGWFGERAVSTSLARLDPGAYQTFHDLYLPRPDGRGTTQLDHVVVSPFGNRQERGLPRPPCGNPNTQELNPANLHA
jgi:hypothetical protein